METGILPENTTLKEIQNWLSGNLPRMKIPSSRKDWKKQSSEIRERYLKYYFQGHPKGLLKRKFKVDWKETIQMPGYKIKKLLYEGYPGIWIPALIYEPDEITGKVPGVLNSNGHHAGGKAMPYKQARCINLAKRGIIALNFEFLGMGELSNILHDDLLYMELCGIRGAGVFYLAMKRALDILHAHPSVDKKRIAMTGLSGGGWQTIILSSLDERIRASIPVAGHSPVWQRLYYPCDIGDGEQIPPDFCQIADYDVLGGFLAPRPTLFIYNKKDDCCFLPKRTRSSIFLPAQKIFSLLGAEKNVDFYVNKTPGTHNYDSDNREQLYKFLNKHFKLKTSEEDIDCHDEILPETSLDVGLPYNNESIFTIVEKEILKLKEQREKRASKSLAVRRKKLTETIKYIPLKISRVKTVSSKRSSNFTEKKKILICDNWSIAAIESSFQKTEKAMLCISDWGKSQLMEHPHVKKVLGTQNSSVLAADIFNTGEASIETPNLHMLISSAGKRSLGGQVAQILALAEWMSKTYKIKKIDIFSAGATAPFTGLLALSIRPELFLSFTAVVLPKYASDMIRWRKDAYNSPLLNCPGLIKHFEMRDLIEMSECVEIFIESRGKINETKNSVQIK